MYIIELILKTIKNKNHKKIEPTVVDTDESEHCDHIYYAIDSTADYLACSKCGNVIKNSKKNIFKV